MNTQELEIVIKDYLETLYNIEYVKKLEVVELNPGYQLRLDLSNHMAPMTISCDLAEEDFLNLVFKEVRNNNLDKTEYYKLIKKS